MTDPTEPEVAVPPADGPASVLPVSASGGPADTAPPEPETTEPETPEPETPEPDPLVTARVIEVIDPRQVRRAPRLGAFLAVGLLLAFLLAVGLSFVRDAMLPAEQVQARSLDSWGTFWVLFAFLAPIGALCAYAIAVAVDRRSIKRWRARQPGGTEGQRER